jgi:hypothetical protein
MQLIVMTIDALRELMRGERRGILREAQMGASGETKAEQGASQTCWVGPAD